MFQTKVVEKNKTHILHSGSFFFENHAVNGKVWKMYGKAKQAIDGNIMLPTGFACWITKTTNTNSEYVLQCCSLTLRGG